MELRQLREKATEAFARGRFAAAAELYEDYCRRDPRDHQAKLRMGDAWARAGEREKGIAAYRSAAEAFAQEGFLPRAIAASKLILELEPTHAAVQQMLAGLYARKGGAAPKANPPSRIWLPGTPGEAAVAPPRDAGPAPEATPWARPRGGDLQRASSRFDELSLEDAPVTPGPDSTRPPSFTELELDGESLLHAVELVARAGEAARGEAPAEPGGAEEEVFSVAGELPKIPLFSDLPHDAFVELFERSPLRRFAQGEQVIAQGSVGDAFYVVCDGAVRVVRDGRELAVLKEGAFFGEMALLSGAPRSATVESASQQTQVLEISAPVLAQLSHRHPPVAQALKRFCRQRMLANVMQSSALFQPFSRSDRRSLVERFRAREVQRGAVLIREGEDADGLYVILSGEVEVTRAGQALATLRQGEVFGEMSLLRKTPATATVTAARRTSLLRLPRPEFDALVLSHPQILVLVSELSEDRQRATDAVLGEDEVLLV